MKAAGRTLLAAFLSVAVHGGAVAALVVRGEETVDIAGGATSVAIVGDGSVDAVSAGADLPPVQPLDATEMNEPVTEIAAPVDTPPVQTALALPTQPAPARLLDPVPEPTPVEPVAPAQPTALSEPEAAPQAEPASPVQAVEAATNAEIQASEAVSALETVPLPAARPQQAEPVRTAAVDPTPTPPRHEPLRPKVTEPAPKKPEQARKKPAAQQPAGNGGKSQSDARKGVASGSSAGEQAEEGDRSGKAARQGNAATSNYPGKVVSKLRRALRYPSEAKRQKIRGEVHVAFTVGSGGGVSGVRVVRSSGSPVLDRAAVETVQRAAPFPPIPDGRANWPFTVPLAFTR